MNERNLILTLTPTHTLTHAVHPAVEIVIRSGSKSVSEKGKGGL